MAVIVSLDRLLLGANQPFNVSFSGILILNVCSHRKRPFRPLIFAIAERLEAAISGH